jgi:DNA replication protein DnaC
VAENFYLREDFLRPEQTFFAVVQRGVPKEVQLTDFINRLDVCCVAHPAASVTKTKRHLFSQIASAAEMTAGEFLRLFPDKTWNNFPAQPFYALTLAQFCDRCELAATRAPLNMLHARFGSYVTQNGEQRMNRSRCWQFSRRCEGMLLLAGPPGVGKTHLGLSVLRRKWLNGFYIREHELIQRHRDTLALAKAAQYGGDFEANFAIERGRFTACDQAKHFSTLVLDEVGGGALFPTDVALIRDLLLNRYESKRKTIIITNLDGPSLKAHLGPHVADRIRHASADGKFMLTFSSDSYRRKIAY